MRNFTEIECSPAKVFKYTRSLKNIALTLREEKTVHLHRNSDFVPNLVDHYNETQTYFISRS